MNVRRLGSGAVLLVLAIPGLARGQERPSAAPALTLEEVVARARATHPSLVSAAAARDAAAASVQETGSARLPSLSADAQITRFGLPMVVAPLHGFDPQNPPTFDRTLAQGNLSLNYTLFDGGGRGARIERARALLEAASSGIDASEQALTAEVARAYLRVGTTREVLGANRRQLEALQQEQDRAGRLLAQGRAARVVVLRAQAALSRTQADLVAAEEQARLAERQLARLMGVAAEELTTRSFPALGARPSAAADRAALVASAQRGNAEVARARGRVAAAEAARRESRSLWLPALRLAGRYTEYASGEGTRSGEWQGGVQLSFPLFTGGARGSVVDRADAEARGALADLRTAELRVEEAIDGALASIAASDARVTALDAAVAQNAEVVRIERLALDNGAGLQTDYIAAEADLLRTQASLAEARAAATAARIDLARATGQLTPAWLLENLEIRR